MQITVIILAFEYSDTVIKCSLYDIFRIYKFYQELNYKCYILSDIAKFNFNKETYNLILKNQIDQEFTDFIASLRRKSVWYKLTTNLEELENNLASIPQTELAIIHYSGHGSNKGIELASKQNLGYMNFRNLLLKQASKALTIFMDCCSAGDMNLLFKFDGKQFKLHGNIANNPTIEVLLINSSDTNQKSLADRTASFFTRYLIEFLRSGKYRNIHDMIEYIQNNIIGHNVDLPAISIYSSITRVPYLPSYLFEKYYVNLELSHNYIYFERL